MSLQVRPEVSHPHKPTTPFSANQQGATFASLGGSSETRRLRRGHWLQLCYAAVDMALVVSGALGLFYLRFFIFGLGLRPLPPGSLPRQLAFLMLYAALIFLCCQANHLYWSSSIGSVFEETLAVTKSVAMATLVLMAFIYLAKEFSISRLLLCLSSVINVLTMVSWRLLKRRIVERRMERGHAIRNVLIVGAGNVGQAFAKHLDENKHLGYLVKGFLDQNHHHDPRLLGTVDDLARVARAQFVDDIFITIPSERDVVKELVWAAREARISVHVVPDLFDGLGWHAPLGFVGHFPVMEIHREPIPAFMLLVKRACDIVVSAVALILLAPVMALVALVVRLDSAGPAVFRALRVGNKGRIFKCYKFRTMVANAEQLFGELQHLNERTSVLFKIANDPRVTRVGKFLRKYSLDELPQLWNVLKGDMSLVGPRPAALEEYKEYSLEHLRRLDVKPGITGLWQTTARQDPSFENYVALDLEYVQNWNAWLDVKILLKTIPEVLKGTGQ